MEKNKAIELAKQAKQNNAQLNGSLYVTEDETVFSDAAVAVGHASSLDAGDPQVTEVSASEYGVDLAGDANLTNEQKVAAAKTKVAEMQKLVDEKTAAKDAAEGRKKGAATNALNKAVANLELAKKELVDAEALT